MLYQGKKTKTVKHPYYCTFQCLTPTNFIDYFKLFKIYNIKLIQLKEIQKYSNTTLFYFSMPKSIQQ